MDDANVSLTIASLTRFLSHSTMHSRSSRWNVGDRHTTVSQLGYSVLPVLDITQFPNWGFLWCLYGRNCHQSECFIWFLVENIFDMCFNRCLSENAAVLFCYRWKCDTSAREALHNFRVFWAWLTADILTTLFVDMHEEVVITVFFSIRFSRLTRLIITWFCRLIRFIITME